MSSTRYRQVGGAKAENKECSPGAGAMCGPEVLNIWGGGCLAVLGL
jgi:hypothetical protein